MIRRLLQKGLRSKGSLLSFKSLALGIVASATIYNAQGQSMANYAFAASSTGSLVDMSSGTTSLTAASNAAASSVQPIGFDFYFMGVKYNYFSVNADGQMKLHTSSGAAAITNNGATSNAYVASSIVLAPMAGNNRTYGGSFYKVTGTPGNKRLVVSWKQFVISEITGFTASLLGDMQAWLDETTGTITYAYGEIYNSSPDVQSRAAYISSGNVPGQSGLVTIGGTPTYVFDAASTTPTTSGNYTGNTPTGTPYTLAENLGSTADGSRVTFTFTPGNAPSTAPSGLTGTGTGISTMTLNWTDNANNELGYNVEYSTDNINWISAATLAANAITYNLTGLLPGTNYYLRVTAFTEGVVSAPATATAQTNACAGITGTVTVGATGTYPSITSALTALNTSGFSGGAVALELQSDYNPAAANETYPIVLSNLLCAGSNNPITIRPAAGVATPIVLTSATASSQTININGGSNYIIDGRPGGTGTTSMLTIANTVTTGSSIQFINGANNNTIKYCKVTGVTTGTTNGVITFSTSASNTIGNSFNTISNCDLTQGVTNPAILLYAVGTAANPNAYNNILNNNFSNFNAASAFGIQASTACTKWLIDGNSFYQTSATASGSIITAINIVTTGDSMTVRNNYIGGSGPLATGTWSSNAATTSNLSRILGIGISAGATNPSNIDNNTITNFVLNTSSAGSAAAATFMGILASGGNVNIGANAGNTIGSQSVNNAILVNGGTTIAQEDGGLVGILVSSTGVVNVTNNLIGGLNGSCTAAANTFRVKGIYVSGSTGKKTIANNFIGGTTPNSISSGTNASTTFEDAYGIQYNSSASGKIQNNTVRNITAGFNTSNGSNRGWGIYTQSSGLDTIINNTIYNITNYGTNGSIGIYPSSTGGQLVAYNNIYSIAQKGAPSTAGSAIGIYNSATANMTIAYNTIQDIRQDSTNAGGSLTGMNINTGGTYRIYNNTINLDNAGGAISNAKNIIGIIMPTANATLNNNIIKVNALANASTVGRSVCLRSSVAPTATIFNANNNLYYINNADSNYIFLQGSLTAPTKAFHANIDGTVSGTAIIYDADFNTNCSAYKTYINSLAADKEIASFTENIALTGGSVLPNNLQPNPLGTSYAQNGGRLLAYLTDILGNPVDASTPDIGAIEFATGSSVAGAGSYLANNVGATNTVAGDATATVKLYNADCELIAQVTPSGAAQIAGNITAQAWIDNGAGNYAKRHTQITPANSPTTATATVTLYYTKQEFLDYNTANPSALPMPTGTTDNGNLRIQKLNGSSNDGTGLPNSYPSAVPTTIIPASVTWNTDGQYWAVTFDVAGFSGFFLNTDPNPTPLPIDFANFNVIAQFQSNQLTWTMGNAAVKGSFEVLHSIDGAKFESIGTVAGNDRNNYTFNHETPKAMEVYQIKFTEASGKAYYSKTQMVQRKDRSNLAMMLYPNPTSQNAVLKVNVMNAANANAAYIITNILGEEVMKGTIETKGNNDVTAQINIGSLANGIYNFKLVSGNDQILRKLVITEK